MEEIKPSQKLIMLCAIGPVQEFIAQARRTRDLWFGSYLLSELSKEAAFQIARSGGELIFPYLRNEDDQAVKKLRVANKILAIVETADPKRIAWEVRQSVTKKWLEYARDAKEQLGACINQGMWDRQVKDLIEFQAVWVPLYSEDQYQVARERAEQLLAARKTLRDFKQHEIGKLRFGEKKSSLDSGRESVLFPEKASIYMSYGIKEKEKLDAVALVKRLSFSITNREDKFPSVCEIAFKHFKATLKEIQDKDEENLAHKCVKEYYAALHALSRRLEDRVRFEDKDIDSYDYRLFYESHIEDYIVDHIAEQVRSSLSEVEKQETISYIKHHLGMLEDKLNRNHINLNPYYAFLVADGDRMGDLLDTLTSYQEHQRVSEQLSHFSVRAEAIVKEHSGELIYSGGDDVMAYVSLNEFFKLSESLSREFQHVMKQVVPKGCTKPTLSVGVAIVHMLEPLEDVRNLAKQAERMAKVKKDELAIIYQKRSGGDQMRVSLPFSIHPCERVKELRDYYRWHWISSQFAFGLRDLHDQYQQMFGTTGWNLSSDEQRVLIWQEIVRLALKKAPSNEIKPDIEQKVLPYLKKIYETQGEAMKQLKMLAELVILAVTLEKAGNNQ
ncbi:type III-B CRISPR-associated protein Cas10/Cmr2 [Paenibacillus aquistagni]|uniref:type III-B CRISPR-associated protein Cas10/Cmr2 n=1 Tax=Paenibacillus aquistagni TaxID=1852522 RepID=UPI00145ABB10|nr:type III-B CRISPR-associated protein Cas10/Cmr2 [Paenibacillus aquistagni]NMM53366.1 type III-B CRISPR-associated protein Cas10/Cmr2 [Paenibacillus aquistagni]